MDPALTRGRAVLLAVLQRTTAAEVAARLRTSEASVSRWAAGYHCPAQGMRERLQECYGIAVEAWSAPDRLR